MGKTIADNRETHPSYGMLGFSRITRGEKTSLFGTSMQHSNTIVLRLKAASRRRGLNNDWYYGGKQLFEVEMSYSQFAELITEIGVGDGIPVTIRRINGQKMPDPPFEDKGEIHIREFEQHMKDTYEDAKALIRKVSEIFSSRKSINKADRESILSALTKIANSIGTDQSYQVQQFQSTVEKTVTEAKGEIEAFIQHKVIQVGQQKLVEETPDLFAQSISVPEIGTGKCEEE